MLDLQLDVKGCRDVYASFDKYVEVESLEGITNIMLNSMVCRLESIHKCLSHIYKTISHLEKLTLSFEGVLYFCLILF